jgi:protein-S-isoprenylcysteine O-methyltransferase Ste14
MPAILVFGLSQLVATLIHLDILDWSHPTAEAWLAVYIISPIGVAVVMFRQERGAALQWMRARTRDLDRARVGLLATVAVTVLQLIGALMNRSSSTGPSASIEGYCVFSAALGLTAVGALLTARRSTTVALTQPT